jgi:hypothetical protein
LLKGLILIEDLTKRKIYKRGFPSCSKRMNRQRDYV